MARKHHRRKTHHRRRVGASKGMGSAIKKIGGIAAGAFAARLVVTKLGATMNPKIANAIPIVLGVLVPRFIKSDIGQGIGDGLIAVGVLGELQQFNVVSGIGYMAPGVAALTHTGATGYNPETARTVGTRAGYRMGDPGTRPFINQAVGRVNGLGSMKKSTLTRLGALLED